MKSMTQRFAVLFAALALIAFSASANAESKSKGESFAEQKVVLQISDADPSKQTLVLNVANNLVKHYGPDQVAIEIVAFGPGLRLMFAENSNSGRIQGLAQNGVKFSACANTMKKMTKLRDGYAPKLNPEAVQVDAGVVQIMDLVKQGYTLVKP